MRVLLCPLSNPGYLYSSLAIGRQLRSQGHLIAVLCEPSVMDKVTRAGLIPVNLETYGPSSLLKVGSWRFQHQGVAQYHAIRAVTHDFSPDVLLTSILCHGALLAAERLDIPAVVLGLTSWLWPFRRGRVNPAEDAFRDYMLDDLRRFYHEVRVGAGFSPRRDQHPDQPFLGASFLLRGHPDLQPPGTELPDEVSYVGPCEWEPPANPDELARIAQHTERVGKPVVYVHLGRRFEGTSLWPRLNAAFTGGPLQAIVERARSSNADPAPGADLLPIRKPWMDPLVSLASLVLTNATSAPVLAALRHGRPLVVAPNGSEQPLLAAACRRAGVAVGLPDQPAHAAGTLSAALADRQLADRAQQLGSRLGALGGARQAAQIVAAQVSPRSGGQEGHRFHPAAPVVGSVQLG